VTTPNNAIRRSGPSLVDQAYRDLKSAIIDGLYPPGSSLRLSELTETYDMSVIPIREALRKLEVERLVETEPNRGARVAAISVEDVQDAYMTRVMLEGEAIRRGWDRITPELVAELYELQRQLMNAYIKGRLDEAPELHRRLHFRMYEAAGSPWLLHLIEILWNHTERYRRLSLTLRPNLGPGEDIHVSVIQAMESRRRADAIRALRLDLEHTAKLIVEHYTGTQS
jgi:DNA-binding GntR family transcriptional regulator